MAISSQADKIFTDSFPLIPNWQMTAETRCLGAFHLPTCQRIVVTQWQQFRLRLQVNKCRTPLYIDSIGNRLNYSRTLDTVDTIASGYVLSHLPRFVFISFTYCLMVRFTIRGGKWFMVHNLRAWSAFRQGRPNHLNLLYSCRLTL